MQHPSMVFLWHYSMAGDNPTSMSELSLAYVLPGLLLLLLLLMHNTKLGLTRLSHSGLLAAGLATAAVMEK